MGCWNGTCAISNLHITAGTPVAVFMLLKVKGENSFCYGNALYDVCPIPFYGEYNDYGGVEECHGFGLNIVVEALRKRLYKFGEGPNSVHDIEVNKDNFDVEMMFEADHEDRLGIDEPQRWDSDEYELNQLRRLQEDKGVTDSQQYEMDRLASKIKKVDNFRRVTHVIIHGDVFKAIMEDWAIEEYVGDGKGNYGYNNNYIQIRFKDIEATIPDYIARLKAQKEEWEQVKAEFTASANNSGISPFNTNAYRIYSMDPFEWNDPCMAGRYMRSFSSGGESNVWGLVRVSELVDEYKDNNDWENLALFAKEALTAVWINNFMSYTRKLWTKQSGAGSQSSEPEAYTLLANTVLNILKAEKAECDSDFGEDDEDLDDPQEVLNEHSNQENL